MNLKTAAWQQQLSLYNSVRAAALKTWKVKTVDLYRFKNKDALCVWIHILHILGF